MINRDSLRHYVIKLILWYQSVPVNVCLFNHDLKLMLWNLNIQLFCESLNVFSRHKPSSLVIEQREHSLNCLLGHLYTSTCSHDIDKWGKVQSTDIRIVQIADDMEQSRTGLLITLSCEWCLEFFIYLNKIPLVLIAPVPLTSNRSNAYLSYAISSFETPGRW